MIIQENDTGFVLSSPDSDREFKLVLHEDGHNYKLQTEGFTVGSGNYDMCVETVQTLFDGDFGLNLALDSLLDKLHHNRYSNN